MFLVVLAYLAFFSIALPDSMLGVAWPSMRISFQQPTSAAGLVPPFGVAANLVSTALSGYLVAKFGVGRLLAVSTLLSAGALAVAASSATLWQFLVSVVLLGLSGGAIDATLNAYAARAFGPRRINLLHASYGVGAAVSPLIVTVVVQTGTSWRFAYGIVAVLQIALAIVFAATSPRWTTGVAPRHRPARARMRGGHRSGRSRVWTVNTALGLAAVAVQTGIESSVALWAYTFLTQGAGVQAVVAGGLASGYWVAMFLGRVALGSLAERIGAWRVMGLAIVGLVTSATLAIVGTSTMATLAILLFGLAAAPIYPLLILTTAERTSAAVADRVIGLQAASSSLGAAVLPSLVGLALDVSARAFAPAIGVLCVIAAVLHACIRARRRTPSANRDDGRADDAADDSAHICHPADLLSPQPFQSGAGHPDHSASHRHLLVISLPAFIEAQRHCRLAPQPLLTPAGVVWSTGPSPDSIRSYDRCLDGGEL